MKREIIDILQKYELRYGFVSVEKYIEERQRHKQGDYYDNRSFLKDFKTIIVIAVPYPQTPVQWKGRGYGVLSRFSYNIDYHKVVGKLLQDISTELQLRGLQTKHSVDTGTIDERFAGMISHLGVYGKNQFLIHPDYGTFFYLGTILINHDIETTPRTFDGCGDCRICIDACPSGALDDGFERSTCISHLSQEKIAFNKEQIKHFKTMIFGCDICQHVCPKNIGIDIHAYQEFEPSGIENINLRELLQMSTKEYMEVYGNNDSSWRGASVIKRNALCLIANQRLYKYKDEIQKSTQQLQGNLWYNKTAELVLELLEKKS